MSTLVIIIAIIIICTHTHTHTHTRFHWGHTERNGYRRKKLNQRADCKSWMRLFKLNFVLLFLGKGLNPFVIPKAMAT